MKIALNATLIALTLAFGTAHAADATPATSTASVPGAMAGEVIKAEAVVTAIDKIYGQPDFCKADFVLS